MKKPRTAVTGLPIHFEVDCDFGNHKRTHEMTVITLTFLFNLLTQLNLGHITIKYLKIMLLWSE